MAAERGRQDEEGNFGGQAFPVSGLDRFLLQYFQ